MNIHDIFKLSTNIVISFWSISLPRHPVVISRTVELNAQSARIYRAGIIHLYCFIIKNNAELHIPSNSL